MSLTPEQFNLLTTKDDLRDLESSLREDLMTKEDKNEILAAIDKISKSFKNQEQESLANLAAHDRLDDKIDNHEKRLSVLELKNA